jgi:hypothetical protein
MFCFNKVKNYITFQTDSALSKQRYVRRHIFLNFAFNMALNAALPYFALQSLEHIPLYGTKESVILCILPMFFILPFLVTLVVLTQTLIHSQKGNVEITIPQQNTGKLFRLRLGFISGIAWLLIASIAFIAWIYLNQHATVSVPVVTFISSVSSGILSVLVIIQAISQFQKS